MAARPLLDALPLWALALVTVAVMLFSTGLGHLVGSTGRRRGIRGEGRQLDTIVAATLALLAFMLAFTFGAAGARFDERRALVIKDANAIEVAYLRAATLPAPYAVQSQRLLRAYVELRLRARDQASLIAGLEKSETLQHELWDIAVAAAKKAPDPITATYLEALNALIDVHHERATYAMQYRVPAVIWAGLYVLTIVSMILVGEQMGFAGYFAPSAIVLLCVAFGMVIAVIAALDRPLGGLAVSQQAMQTVERAMSR